MKNIEEVKRTPRWYLILVLFLGWLGLANYFVPLYNRLPGANWISGIIGLVAGFNIPGDYWVEEALWFGEALFLILVSIWFIFNLIILIIFIRKRYEKISIVLPIYSILLIMTVVILIIGDEMEWAWNNSNILLEIYISKLIYPFAIFEIAFPAYLLFKKN